VKVEKPKAAARGERELRISGRKYTNITVVF